jgi:hypothetical protein
MAKILKRGDFSFLLTDPLLYAVVGAFGFSMFVLFRAFLWIVKDPALLHGNAPSAIVILAILFGLSVAYLPRRFNRKSSWR